MDRIKLCPEPRIKKAFSLSDIPDELRGLIEAHPEIAGTLGGTALGAGAGALTSGNKRKGDRTRGAAFGGFMGGIMGNTAAHMAGDVGANGLGALASGSAIGAGSGALGGHMYKREVKKQRAAHAQHHAAEKKGEAMDDEAINKLASALALGTTLAEEDLLGLRKQALETAGRLMGKKAVQDPGTAPPPGPAEPKKTPTPPVPQQPPGMPRLANLQPQEAKFAQVLESTKQRMLLALAKVGQ